MAIALRWFGYVVGALLLIALLFSLWVWVSSARAMSATHEGLPEKLVEPTAAQLADAARHARVAQCYTCHGEGMRGKLMFEEPNVAKVYAPNVTLIAARASDQQLARAIRQGIGVDGRALFIMPSAQYSRITDAEIAAIIRHIRSLPRGGRQTPANEFGPLGRLGVTLGKLPSQVDLVEAYNHDMPPDFGPQTKVGRYLAMTNCSECHGSSFQGGEPKPGSVAPDLVVTGAYDLPAFKRLLRTGVSADGRKLDLMREVSLGGFRYMTDAEMAELHAYLVERAQRTHRSADARN